MILKVSGRIAARITDDTGLAMDAAVGVDDKALAALCHPIRYQPGVVS